MKGVGMFVLAVAIVSFGVSATPESGTKRTPFDNLRIIIEAYAVKAHAQQVCKP